MGETMIPRFKPWLGWPELHALFKPNKGAVERFEKAFAQKFEAVDAVAFPYGRSAQWAFFKALGIQDAEIIMPAYTCSVVAHAVSLSGNTPRFIDIEPADFNMNLDEAEATINEHTRVIIATHTFGHPQNLDRLEGMAKRAQEKYGHKVWLMQDCCHAFGAEWNGRMIGTSGDVAVYALNISKMITSIFGGMLTFQDQLLADKVRAWRDANFQPAGWIKGIKRRLYLMAVYVAFNEKIYGFTWWLQKKTPLLNRFTKAYHLDDKIQFPPDFLNRMAAVEAAVGLENLKRYSKIIHDRLDNARGLIAYYSKKSEYRVPPYIEGSTYSHFTVLVTNRCAAKEDHKNLGIELGELIQYSIPSTVPYVNTKNQAVISDSISKSVVNIPLHKNLDNLLHLKDVMELSKKMARLHLREVKKDDLSFKMGEKALCKFYKLALSGEYGRVFYYENKDGEIISHVIAFTKYTQFKRDFLRVAFLNLLASIITGRLSILGILKSIKNTPPIEISSIYDFHAGFVVRSSLHMPAAGRAFSSLYLRMLAYYRENNVKYIWGVTHESNEQGLQIITANNGKEIRKGDSVYSILSL